MTNKEFGRGRRENTGSDRRYYNWEAVYTPDWVYTEVWMVPGPYSGMGPKGYRRSDDRLREEIISRMTQHGQLDARDIDVEVKNGEATLRGSVNSRREKRIARDIADSVSGVFDVHNELGINRQGQEQPQLAQQRQRSDQHQNRQAQSKQHRSGEKTGNISGKDSLRDRMEVYSSDDELLGWVNAKRDQDFQLDRHGALDLFVPYGAIEKIEEGRVILKQKAKDVDRQGWPEEKEGIKSHK